METSAPACRASILSAFMKVTDGGLGGQGGGAVIHHIFRMFRPMNILPSLKALVGRWRKAEDSRVGEGFIG